MEDELWLKKLKDKLDDYSEPSAASDWEQLEKRLPAYDGLAGKTQKTILFRRWTMTAAAALVLIASSVSVWLLRSSVGDEVRHTSIPAFAPIPDALSEQAIPSVQVDPTVPQAGENNGTVGRMTEHPVLMAQAQPTGAANKGEERNIPRSSQDEIAVQQPVTEEEKDVTTVAEEKETKEEETERYRPAKRDKLHLPPSKRTMSDKKSGGWSVGFSVGNTGGLSANNLTENGSYMQADPASIFNGERMDLSFTADKILTIPKGRDVIFRDGMPLLQRNVRTIASIKHKLPLSFGISVRKNLGRGFSAESGLSYTYLASDVMFEESSETFSQKLHYVGIPIRANWSFVDTKRFTAYISAGGSVEKCVYGKIDTEDQTVKPLQLSVMGMVGAQYNASKRIGLYIEPGISYFFDDGSDVQTIRKENPCNFTLQAGIRLTY